MLFKEVLKDSTFYYNW